MDPKDFNLEKMQKMLNPQNIANTVRMFIGLGSKELVEQFTEQADLAADGAEFLAVSYKTPIFTHYVNSAPSGPATTKSLTFSSARVSNQIHRPLMLTLYPQTRSGMRRTGGHPT